MAKGRPKKDKTINLKRTRRRQPRKADEKKSSAKMATLAKLTQAKGAPKDKKGRSVIGSKSSPFTKALRSTKALKKADLALVEQAWLDGIGHADACALWQFQFLVLQRDRAAGDLEPKNYHTGLNQLLTAAVKLAELAERRGEQVPGQVQISFNLASPAIVQPADPTGMCGDVIDVA